MHKFSDEGSAQAKKALESWQRALQKHEALKKPGPRFLPLCFGLLLLISVILGLAHCG